jgi:hypothetical protein
MSSSSATSYITEQQRTWGPWAIYQSNLLFKQSPADDDTIQTEMTCIPPIHDRDLDVCIYKLPREMARQI